MSQYSCWNFRQQCEGNTAVSAENEGPKGYFRIRVLNSYFVNIIFYFVEINQT